MPNRPSVRPAVESLDSRLLLSTVAPAGTSHRATSSPVHAERHAVAVVVAPATIDLQGTIHAVGTIASTGRQAILAGSGNLGAVGVASIRTKFLAASATEPLAVLSTKHGKIDFTASYQTTQSTATSISRVGPYTITGGTGSYAHATGTGTIQITLTPTSLSKVGVELTFS